MCRQVGPSAEYRTAEVQNVGLEMDVSSIGLPLVGLLITTIRPYDKPVLSERQRVERAQDDIFFLPSSFPFKKNPTDLVDSFDFAQDGACQKFLCALAPLREK